MSPVKPDLVMIGHIINETICFPDRTTSPVLGSPVAYSSVVAAKLGAKVGIVSKIGADMPQELLKPFAEAQVDLEGVQVGSDTTTNLLIYDSSGNKTIRYLKKAPPIFFEDIPQNYLEAQVIYVCPMDYEVPLKTIKALHQGGATLAVDLGGYGAAHSSSHPDPKEQEDPQATRKLVSYFAIVRASSEDCRYLFGTQEGQEEEIAALLVDWGAQIGIVTLGKRGAVAATAYKSYHLPAFSAHYVDGTGAGDSFSAGFLVQYLRTKDVKRSGIFASAVASLVVEGSGGVVAERMPTTQEVEKRIAQFQDPSLD